MKKYILFALAAFLTISSYAQQDSTRYKAIVKFGSRGDGVASNQSILDYAASFKKTYKIKHISYDRIGPMGREGEYWMAFQLKELSKKQKEIFVKKLGTLTENIKGKGYASVDKDEAISPQDFAGKIDHKKL